MLLLLLRRATNPPPLIRPGDDALASCCTASIDSSRLEGDRPTDEEKRAVDEDPLPPSDST